MLRRGWLGEGEAIVFYPGVRPWARGGMHHWISNEARGRPGRRPVRLFAKLLLVCPLKYIPQHHYRDFKHTARGVLEPEHACTYILPTIATHTSSIIWPCIHICIRWNVSFGVGGKRQHPKTYTSSSSASWRAWWFVYCGIQSSVWLVQISILPLCCIISIYSVAPLKNYLYIVIIDW